jgi:hypothetical protein
MVIHHRNACYSLQGLSNFTFFFQSVCWLITLLLGSSSLKAQGLPTLEACYNAYPNARSLCDQCFNAYLSEFSACSAEFMNRSQQCRSKYTNDSNFCSMQPLGAQPACFRTADSTLSSCLVAASSLLAGCADSSVVHRYACIYCALPGVTIACPVVALSIKCKCDNGINMVTWEPSTPVQMERYLVQKSEDGINWSTATSIYSTNANPSKSYMFTDNTTITNNFYRVIGYKLNHHKVYSSIVSSTCNSGFLNNISVLTNPVNSVTTVRITSFKAMPVKLTIYNSQGKAVYEEQSYLYVGANNFPFNLKNLSSGVYALTAAAPGILRTHKLIKK